MKDWVIAVTEDMQVKPTSSGKMSYPQSLPKIWRIVTIFYKSWLKEGWEVPKKVKNVTDFKSKISKWIISNRRRVLTSDLTYSDLNFVQAMPTSGASNPWYLSLKTFLSHAARCWMVDELAASELLEANINDIVRLFSVAARNENRNDVVRLGIGRNQDRAEMDGPLDAIDSIFSGWQKQFNDPDLELPTPARAVHLESYLSIDPNDPSRVKITRTYAWLRSVWSSEIKNYNVATKKWTKGTGGGPGYPENFSNWQARDGEYFANYASAGKGDYLAWIYMLDKGANFVFNTINDPPPPSSVMEDGDTTSGAKSGKSKSKTKNSGEMEFGRSFSDSIDKMGEIITNVFSANTVNMHPANTNVNVNANANANATATTYHVQERRADSSGGEEDPDADVLDVMEQTLTIITRLEMRRDAMRTCQENGDFEGRMPKRIKCVEDAIDKAYVKLGHFGGD